MNKLPKISTNVGRMIAIKSQTDGIRFFKLVAESAMQEATHVYNTTRISNNMLFLSKLFITELICPY